MSQQNPRSALSPDNLGLIEAVARLGSMAAAARELGMVPSALTYRVRQVEDALDVLLFDRSSRRAQLTPAGAELLRSGQHLLDELDAVAQRVKRVATGWEPLLTIAADAIVARATLFELCEAFYAEGVPTRIKLRAETLSGTLESLQRGQADLALGVVLAAAGYPLHPRKGDPIRGLPADAADAMVFHAGTANDAQGEAAVSGGRVLCVTALADTVAAARQKAYGVAEAIQFDGMQFRRDIGYRAL